MRPVMKDGLFLPKFDRNFLRCDGSPALLGRGAADCSFVPELRVEFPATENLNGHKFFSLGPFATFAPFVFHLGWYFQ